MVGISDTAMLKILHDHLGMTKAMKGYCKMGTKMLTTQQSKYLWNVLVHFCTSEVKIGTVFFDFIHNNMYTGDTLLLFNLISA